ncbi:MAG: hypothetical protein ABJC12_02785 [Saprospiraceae bacterium]
MPSVNDVMTGGIHIYSTVARQVLRLVNNRNKKSYVEFNLTDRETNILTTLVWGSPTKGSLPNVMYSTRLSIRMYRTFT